MPCGKSSLISPYLDGELSSTEAAEFEKHLSSCPLCSQTLAQFAEVKEALRALPSLDPPPELRTRVMAAVKHQVHPKRAQFRPRPRLGSVGFSLVAAVVIMLVSVTGTLWYADRNYGLGLFQSTKVALDGTKGPQSVDADFGTSGFRERSEVLSTSYGQHLLVQKSQMDIQVSRGHVADTKDRASEVIQANAGYVESSSFFEGGEYGPSCNLVARVPATQFEMVLGDLSSLGKLKAQETQIQDVSEDYQDLDARLRNGFNEERRLLEILGRADTVGELLQVEGELYRIRADIESMQGRKMLYEKEITMGSVSLNITEEGSGFSLSSPWRNVWQAFLGAWAGLFLFLARVIPSLILVGTFLFLGFRLLRKA